MLFNLTGVLLALLLVPPQPQELRVLFIGNSYTYFNNLPRMLEALGESARPPVRFHTQLIAQGGATLEDHVADPKVAAALRQPWDVVVLQEQSTFGDTYLVNGQNRVHDPTLFHRAARAMAKLVPPRAKLVFVSHWARRAAPEDQAAIDFAVETIAAELKATVLPAGKAWSAARRARPDLELYDPDGSHPAAAGSYLAACVLFSTLTGQTPVGLSNRITGPAFDPAEGKTVKDPKATLADLPADAAKALQSVAWQVHQERASKPTAAVAPPPVRLPIVPAGTRPQEADLIGSWRGSVNIYPTERKPTLELTIHRGAAGLKGELRISFGGQPDDIDSTLERIEVTDRGIRFVSPKGPNKGQVRYEAAFHDGTLRGVAQFVFPPPSPNLFGIGEWSAEKVKRP